MLVLSCFGVFFLSIRWRKFSIAFLSILLFCLFWRGFSKHGTSRYYSIIILFGLFLSACASEHFIFVFKNKLVQKLVFLLLAFLLLLIHPLKDISAFRNLYILDLQNEVRTVLSEEPDNQLYIYFREFRRVGKDYLTFQEQIKIIPRTQDFSLQEIYHNDNLLSKTAYFIISESTDEQIFPVRRYYPQNGELVYSKIEHHFSGYKRNKFISVYKYFPLNPSPEINIHDYYKDAVLKAYVEEYDAFIYQEHNKLIWLIGTEIEQKTEIVYHVYTNRPDLLPEERIPYEFDNLYFRAGGKNEVGKIGRYRVFEKDIPSEYPISFIRVGFNTDGVFISRDFVY